MSLIFIEKLSIIALITAYLMLIMKQANYSLTFYRHIHTHYSYSFIFFLLKYWSIKKIKRRAYLS